MLIKATSQIQTQVSEVLPMGNIFSTFGSEIPYF